MSKNDDDFEFEALLSINEEEEEAQKGDASPAPEEEAEVKKIEAAGFALSQFGGDRFRFEETRRPLNSAQRRRYIVTRENLSDVSSVISDYRDCDGYKGVFQNGGSYVEYLLQVSGSILPAGRLIERLEWDYQRAECDHEFNPWAIRTERRQYSPGFHLTDPSGEVCVELSEISPIAAFRLSNGRHMRSDLVDYTLKVMVSSAKNAETKLDIAQHVADGLLFELDARRDLGINLVPWERARVTSRGSRYRGKSSISFPATSVPREVAALFSFATEAADNPPFSFLSYYQILEYYMPLTSKRDALRRVRREMRDFSFDISNDASVLRVLNVVERTKGLSEEEALKILVRDCVREDKLRELFQLDAFGEYFSQKGPIVGVPPVSLKATNETVAIQAAKRVYALRNRIVHAKDDPKYAETPQLLPRSGEANSLGPDIALARFLALETIADTQD
ncbi:hypothetical protein [Streptomyces sp. NBC_00286]|uniref:hypothetical protein n=1 Tax=Streptomyces sp. NBC_00286 TaxID=2975701 RepID=UPI002E27EAF9|nr:hypothetical protein [Streptomyces sp. NBC_00286]